MIPVLDKNKQTYKNRSWTKKKIHIEFIHQYLLIYNKIKFSGFLQYPQVKAFFPSSVTHSTDIPGNCAQTTGNIYFKLCSISNMKTNFNMAPLQNNNIEAFTQIKFTFLGFPID